MSRRQRATADFAEVTESPGTGVTQEAARMLHTRYALATQFCSGDDVLEVGCGPGMGLGYLSRRAKSVVGGDRSGELLSSAQRHYCGRMPLVRLDAHSLPFRDASFGLVVLFEAIYYLERPEEFIEESKRVLRRPGIIMICSANKEWLEFHRSPHSHRYFSASELRALLAEKGFEVGIFGAFLCSPCSPMQKAITFVRRFAVRLDLIPKTMKGKQLLKRIFYGRLAVLGAEIKCECSETEPLSEISGDGVCHEYKVLYAIGQLPA
jgi:ubiquinone/menaquinone biosynthesis C-methylase UbiE